MSEVCERELPRIRGVVHEAHTRAHLRIRQFEPVAPERVEWLEHVWSVHWDLPPGAVHVQRTVPFPAFNLVADRSRGCALFGCSSHSFDYRLAGKGQVIGFRLRPGAQGAFWPGEAAGLTDGLVPARDLAARGLAASLAALAEGEVGSAAISRVLGELMRAAHPLAGGARDAGRMVAHVAKTPGMLRVGDLAAHFAISERSLQRLFARHVGLSPKQVIDRFRIHQALGALQAGSAGSLSALALRLEYFDQAHFTNSFRRMTGFSPEEYSLQDAIPPADPRRV